MSLQLSSLVLTAGLSWIRPMLQISTLLVIGQPSVPDPALVPGACHKIEIKIPKDAAI